MVIDAHAHVFPEIAGVVGSGPTRGTGYGKMSINGLEKQLFPPLCEETRFTPEMLLANMDWAGVDKAVLLQGPFYGECNGYALAAVEKYPDRFAAVAYFDPWASEARRVFEGLKPLKGFCGIKLECSEAAGFFGFHQGAGFGMPEISWLWDALETMGWVMVLDLGSIGSSSYQTEAIFKIALEHPSLKIVVAHLGQPEPYLEKDSNKLELWSGQIDLGLNSNVWFDMAALPAYFASESNSCEFARNYVKLAVEKIGAEKIMFGTDAPGLLLHANYKQLKEFMEYAIADLTAVEKDRIRYGNAMKVFLNYELT